MVVYLKAELGMEAEWIRQRTDQFVMVSVDAKSMDMIIWLIAFVGRPNHCTALIGCLSVFETSLVYFLVLLVYNIQAQ